MNILLLRNTVADGRSVSAGQEVEVSDATGRALVQMGKAREIAPKVVETSQQPEGGQDGAEAQTVEEPESGQDWAEAQTVEEPEDSPLQALIESGPPPSRRGQKPAVKKGQGGKA